MLVKNPFQYESPSIPDGFEYHYPISLYFANNKQAIIGINDSIPTLGKD
jgi:hypothetical protein